jgi:hypothetical protein
MFDFGKAAVARKQAHHLRGAMKDMSPIPADCAKNVDYRPNKLAIS